MGVRGSSMSGQSWDYGCVNVACVCVLVAGIPQHPAPGRGAEQCLLGKGLLAVKAQAPGSTLPRRWQVGFFLPPQLETGPLAPPALTPHPHLGLPRAGLEAPQ